MSDDPQQMREKLLASFDRPLFRTLDEFGISDELLVKKLKEELDATATKQFQYEGNVVQAPNQPAWEIRQRARQDAHKSCRAQAGPDRRQTPNSATFR